MPTGTSSSFPEKSSGIPESAFSDMCYLKEVILPDKIKTIGNGALSGAIQMLFDDKQIEIASSYAEKAIHIELGGNSEFYENFINNIDF